MKTRAGRIEGHAYVDGKLACQATLTCSVVSRVRESHMSAEPPAAEEAVTAE